MNERSVEERLSQYPYEPSANQWVAVFDESPIGIVLCSVKGEILKANNSFCQIVEYAETELYNKSYKDITHPDDLCYDERMVKRCLSGEIPGYEMFKRYLTKTGKIVWVRLTVWSIKNEDNVVINLCAHAQKMVNGERSRLEKENKDIVYRPQLSFKDFIYDNIKTFVTICVILVTSFTSIGVAYWGAINQVSDLRREQQQQQELLFKLYSILSNTVDHNESDRDSL